MGIPANQGNEAVWKTAAVVHGMILGQMDRSGEASSTKSIR
jgi:hypothetical protein